MDLNCLGDRVALKMTRGTYIGGNLCRLGEHGG